MHKPLFLNDTTLHESAEVGECQLKIFRDQTQRKYGTRPGSKSGHLDLTDCPLGPDNI